MIRTHKIALNPSFDMRQTFLDCRHVGHQGIYLVVQIHATVSILMSNSLRLFLSSCRVVKPVVTTSATNVTASCRKLIMLAVMASPFRLRILHQPSGRVSTPGTDAAGSPTRRNESRVVSVNNG